MKIFRVALIVLVALSILIGGRWYAYVTNTGSPYDEVGIEINSRLPLAIRKWGCDRLRQTFPNNPPPYGCAAADSRNWI